MGNFCSNVHKSREEWLKTPNKPRRPATNATTFQNTTIPTSTSATTTTTPTSNIPLFQTL